MRKGIIVWHYTDLVCISRGYRINHSYLLWTLPWYSSENKPFWLKAKVSPMTDIPQQCAFSNTVLPPSAFAKSCQVLRYVNSSGIISWGEEEDEEEDADTSHSRITSRAKIFACDQLCSQQIHKCGQTVDKFIWTEIREVQLQKATKCGNTTCSYTSLWTDIHTVPPKEKHWSYYSEDDPHVLWLTYTPSLVSILAKLIFAIGALLPLQWVDGKEKTFLASKSSNSARPGSASRLPALTKIWCCSPPTNRSQGGY